MARKKLGLTPPTKLLPLMRRKSAKKLPRSERHKLIRERIISKRAKTTRTKLESLDIGQKKELAELVAEIFLTVRGKGKLSKKPLKAVLEDEKTKISDFLIDIDSEINRTQKNVRTARKYGNKRNIEGPLKALQALKKLRRFLEGVKHMINTNLEKEK